MIKPDAFERGIVEEIFKRIKDTGLSIVKEKEIFVTREQAERLYAAHRNNKYFEPLVEYIMSGKVKVMQIEGENAINIIRSLIGPTNPEEAPAGTIRGDYKLKSQNGKVIKNTIHGSDSVESAKRELLIFFE